MLSDSERRRFEAITGDLDDLHVGRAARKAARSRPRPVADPAGAGRRVGLISWAEIRFAARYPH